MKMVIFDLDGTLADSLADLALNVNKGLKAAGLPEHPVDAYRSFVGNGRVTLVKRAMGDARRDHTKFNTVISTFNKEYLLHCNDNTTAYDGCPEMLRGLADKGVLTAVLSNKPDGESLRSMLWLHHVAPDECVYVGDSDVDVNTARNAGVKMAGVAWGFRGKQELLDAGAPFVADTPAELLDYLLGA